MMQIVMQIVKQHNSWNHENIFLLLQTEELIVQSEYLYRLKYYTDCR